MGCSYYSTLQNVAENDTVSAAQTAKKALLRYERYGARLVGLAIMLAKISGIFKRRYALGEITGGNIRINKASRTVYKGEKELEMTTKEFELLLLLILDRSWAAAPFSAFAIAVFEGAFHNALQHFNAPAQFP